MHLPCDRCGRTFAGDDRDEPHRQEILRDALLAARDEDDPVAMAEFLLRHARRSPRIHQDIASRPWVLRDRALTALAATLLRAGEDAAAAHTAGRIHDPSARNRMLQTVA